MLFELLLSKIIILKRMDNLAFQEAIKYAHIREPKDRSIVWVMNTTDQVYNFFTENLNVKHTERRITGLEDMPKDLDEKAKERYIRRHSKPYYSPEITRGKMILEVVPGSYAKMCSLLNDHLKKTYDKYDPILLIRIGKCDKLESSFISGLVNLGRGFIQGASSTPYPKIDPFSIIIFSDKAPVRNFVEDIDIYVASNEHDCLMDGKASLKSTF